jgi:putative endonuclease
MEHFYFYILYSPSLDKYYIGHTSNLFERLKKHNTKHKGFTGRANDWIIVCAEVFETKIEAAKRETQIKGWKNRERLETLISKNPYDKERYSMGQE